MSTLQFVRARFGRLFLVCMTLALLGCGGGGGGDGSSSSPTGEARLVSIAVSAEHADTSLRKTQQYRALGSYSDGVERDLSEKVMWNIEDVSVATVSNAAGMRGLVAAVAVGTTRITATSGDLAGSTDVKVPGPRFAYAANAGDGTVSIYLVDDGTGALSHRGYALAGLNTTRLAVHPSQQFLYAINENSDTISIYRIDAHTGMLTEIPTSPTRVDAQPAMLVFDATGQFAYVTSFALNNVGLFRVDPTSGAMSDTGVRQGTDGPPTAALADPSGRRLYIASATANAVRGYNIQGDGRLVAFETSVPTGGRPLAMAMNKEGRHLYVTTSADATIASFAINGTSGHLASIGTTGAADPNPWAIAIDPEGRFAFVTNSNGRSVSMHAIDAATGVPAGSDASVATGELPTSIVIDPSGRYAYATALQSNNISLFRLNESSALVPNSTPVSAQAFPRQLVVTKGYAPVRRRANAVFVTNGEGVSGYHIDGSTGNLQPTSNLASTAALSLAVDSDRQIALVGSANGISSYRVDGTSATLSQLDTTFVAGVMPTAIAIDPSARFGYVYDSTSGNILAYGIETDGKLTHLGSVSHTSPGGVTRMAIDPSGRFLYASDFVGRSVAGYAIDLKTGSLSLRAGPEPLGTNPYALSMLASGAGFLLGDNTGNIHHVSIDPQSGDFAGAGVQHIVEGVPSDLLFDAASATLIVLQYDRNELLTSQIDERAEGWRLASRMPTGLNPLAMAFASGQDFLYEINTGDGTLGAFHLGADGQLTAVGSMLSAGAQPTGIALLESVE
jgi:6-phosphogluconolactonase (cycloisomerase 2 family)